MGSIEFLWDNKSKVVFDLPGTCRNNMFLAFFFKVSGCTDRNVSGLTNSCHVSYTKRPMPRGTMLRAAVERDGSGSTVWDSHPVGAS